MSTVLITGCSTGLGVAMSVKAAQAGHTVVATMRNLDKRGQIDAALTEAGVTADVRMLDVTDQTSIDACIAGVLNDHGRIDVLINNAGAAQLRTTEQASDAELQWITDVNYYGVVRMTKAVLPGMRETRSGRIINISSVGGLVGQPFNDFYCAAKFAVEGYTESLASYVGPAFGIHFSLIEPGGINTAFADNALAHFAQSGGMLDDEYKPLLEAYIGGAQSRAESSDDPGSFAYQSADAVADIVMDVMSAGQPPLRTRTSDWSEAFTARKTQADPTGLKQRDDVVERFLGTYDFGS
ncbi:SDR family oxidoreductase [Algimonas porphyrae]|nr:SDR family oxidoreductase [Algimonas porphyrae]